MQYIVNKIIVFADDHDQFKSFKRNEKFFKTEDLVYFHDPNYMMPALLNCVVLDIRKTDINQKHLDFINNFPVWKKIN